MDDTDTDEVTKKVWNEADGSRKSKPRENFFQKRFNWNQKLTPEERSFLAREKALEFVENNTPEKVAANTHNKKQKSPDDPEQPIKMLPKYEGMECFRQAMIDDRNGGRLVAGRFRILSTGKITDEIDLDENGQPKVLNLRSLYWIYYQMGYKPGEAHAEVGLGSYRTVQVYFVRFQQHGEFMGGHAKGKRGKPSHVGVYKGD